MPRWERLPLEMRELPQWVLAGADKVPLAIDEAGKLRAVSSTRPGEWMTFERAVAGMLMHANLVTTHTTEQGQVITRTGLDLGFVLQEGDPFTCIDLDTKDAETHPNKPEVWTSNDNFQRQISIVKTMASYTERSRSGKGVHVWIKGNIGRGYRRGGVEVYSQERYMIMTGDVWIDAPIAEREQILLNMISQMRPIGKKVELEEFPPDADDWYIFEIAATAANSDKFWKLWRGQWQGMGFPSQSEADLALLSMFTFYSDSNSQCRSLFRASGLAREKTNKSDYHLNKALELIRARQARERAADLSGIMASADFRDELRAAVEEAQGGAPAAPSSLDVQREVTNLGEPGAGDPVQPPPPPDSALAQLAPVAPRIAAAGSDGLAWPPGFVGKVAQFIYGNSYLPIKEVSIVAALGLMAGICGKAWHIPQSGLNLYIILVGRSGIGKEAMHTGISTLIQACMAKDPFFGNYVDFSEFASGQALIKACLTNPSFLNVSGEWGRRLKRIASDDGRDSSSQTLRTQMTNLYQKSGPQSIAGGMTYSNAESNVASVQGVAYSMIGESTPGTFYQALTESMMEDGFLSRFLIVGYDGDRPENNAKLLTEPDDALRDAVIAIANGASKQIGMNSSTAVGRKEAAANIMAAFEAECANNIRATNDESRRQMWNRATLKAMRVAALLAVGDHYLSPAIDVQHIEWAISLVRSDIAMMSRRLEEGDVGLDDRSRERKLVNIIRDYMTKPVPQSYKVPPKMHTDGLVPRNYLQLRTQQVAAFSNHKFGAVRGLNEAIQHCIDNGWLMECKQDKVIEMYSHHGKTYRVLDLPDYANMSKEK